MGIPGIVNRVNSQHIEANLQIGCNIHRIVKLYYRVAARRAAGYDMPVDTQDIPAVRRHLNVQLLRHVLQLNRFAE